MSTTDLRQLLLDSAAVTAGVLNKRGDDDKGTLKALLARQRKAVKDLEQPPSPEWAALASYHPRPHVPRG